MNTISIERPWIGRSDGKLLYILSRFNGMVDGNGE